MPSTTAFTMPGAVRSEAEQPGAAFGKAEGFGCALTRFTRDCDACRRNGCLRCRCDCGGSCRHDLQPATRATFSDHGVYNAYVAYLSENFNEDMVFNLGHALTGVARSVVPGAFAAYEIFSNN